MKETGRQLCMAPLAQKWLSRNARFNGFALEFSFDIRSLARASLLVRSSPFPFEC